MSIITNLFKQNKLNIYEEEFISSKQQIKQTSYSSFMDKVMNNNNNTMKHQCTRECNRICNQSIAKSVSTMFNTLPNNSIDHPVLIESRNNNLKSSNQTKQTSKFSNFNNYKAMLDKKHRERSKYFDVYYPNTGELLVNGKKESTESISSSQSISSNEEYSNRSDQNKNFNSKLNHELNKFNLQTNPVQFNMDKVTYVKTIQKTKSIVELIMKKSKVISLNCDSDCCLQNGIDLLEVAVCLDNSLDHPDIYIFDVYSEPKIIELFKPVLANSSIVKVMFDARFDLRILSRKYGVDEFTALFDLQLAYRVLLSKLTKSSFKEVKREKLLYVSWQCNGPLVNFEKLYLPNVYYFKNKPFWKTRPVNFEIMYNGAYDVFVMVPQLFTNLGMN
jgi:hypothetical protein